MTSVSKGEAKLEINPSSRATLPAVFLLAMFLLAVLLMAVLLMAGCTALVDLDECQTDEDCVASYSRPSVCSEANLCQQQSILQPDGEPCSQKSGDIDDPRAFNIGVLLPLSGPEAGFGEPLLDAIELAQQNFNEIGGVNDHPIGLIICDTQGRDDLALDAARHLVGGAGVTAIIGPDYSSQTIDVAQQVTIDKGVLLVTPSGTATTISDLDDNGLVWRTTPSDKLQGRAVGKTVEAILDDQLSSTRDSAKVVLMTRKSDVYASGLRGGLIGHLPQDIQNDTTGRRFSPLEYQNSSAGEGSDYSGVIGQILSEDDEPDIVIILGSSEAWDIARNLDHQLVKEPFYVFVDAARNSEQALTTHASFEGRIWGTAPRSVGDSDYVPWQSFKTAYHRAYQLEAGDYQFIANAYDALYAIGLAAAGTDLSGPQIADGMTKLSSGAKIGAHQSDLSRALELRAGAQSIDLDGASGPLDFNADGDPTTGEISLWCFDDGGVPSAGVILSRDGKFNARSCPPTSNE
jgi:branched-chain amino acid transport system substrate-binding protein